MRYRSKPTEIEAYQLTEALIVAHLLDGSALPGVAVTSHSVSPQKRELVGASRQHVTTIQGEHVAVKPGEWIVQEPDGTHYYPIADEVFRRKYEPIE